MKKLNIQNGSGISRFSVKITRKIKVARGVDSKAVVTVKRLSMYPMHGGPGSSMI
ncbi:MAG: hypothetical protein Q8Q03_01550 [bacterium]|nr:hypothetical protein [bacterium]